VGARSNRGIFLGAVLLGYETTEENLSLAAIWAFLFSFGVVSVAGLLAAKAEFMSKAYMCKNYMYSIGGAATLFLGYTVLGLLAGLYSEMVQP
jgi:hypothetical protein